MQAAAPTPLANPGLQAPEHEAVVNPVVRPAYPAGHSKQEAVPPREYWPAGQAPEQLEVVKPLEEP